MKEKEIVISGYYGFDNAGDEAMLSAIIQNLLDVEPNLKITVISGNPKDTSVKHGVKAIYRLNYPKIIAALKESDLLISGGGSLLQDVTSDRSLYYYLSIMMLAKKLGKKVMLYAQGIGPVLGITARAAMRYIGNMADLITVRDEGSFQELKRLNVNKPPVYITADPVLAMHQADKQIGRIILRECGAEGAAPLVGVSVREWKDWSHYKLALAQAADALISDFKSRVVFLPMQWPEDFHACQKTIEKMKYKNSAISLKRSYTTNELLSLVGNFDFLIGVRLHALIFAAIMNVPLVGVSYDPKIDRFLETIGEKQVSNLKSVTAQGLLDCIKPFWPCQSQIANEQNDYKKERLAKVNLLKNKAFQNAELAIELIEK